MTGAKTHLKHIDKAYVTVTDEELRKKKPLTKNEASFDNYQARFSSITPTVSTRMNPIQFLFTTTVTVQTSKVSHEISLQSLPSNPIIIITNESQWADAAHRMLFEDIFKNEVQQRKTKIFVV